MTYMLPCNIFEYVLIYTLEYPAATSLFANIGTHMATLTFMTHTIFDHGASEQLGQVLAQHGITRPLLCTDKGLVDLGMVTDLAAKLGNDAGLTIFDGTPENPTQMAVEEAVEKYIAAGCDGVVALGG